MTRFSLTILFISLFFLNTLGQSDTGSENRRASYSESFMSYRSNNVDSSLYFIRLIATNPAYSNTLQHLIHDELALSFDKMWEGHRRQITAYKILEAMMSDSSETIVNSARPLYCWADVLRNTNDNNELTKLTNGFIKTELSKDIYNNRAAKYALLIYQVISQKKELNKLAEKLLNTTIRKLKAILVNQDSLSMPLLGKKAWYKYLYAYANFIQADEYIKQHKDKSAGENYKIAAAYSPDLSDKQYIDNYFFDKYLLAMYFHPEKLRGINQIGDYFGNDYVSF